MDVLFFFKRRTEFIRRFYETAGTPFLETLRKIDAEEPPFDDPPYTEDEEPPYLEEWIEAREGLEVLGRTCVSMLSTSLRLYFETWEREFGIRRESGEHKRTFKGGFLQHYKTCFEKILQISWVDCPANIELIEQMILARNRDQHPDHITTMRVRHKKKDLSKYPLPFFMNESEKEFHANSDMEGRLLMDPPTIEVSPDALRQALAETEKLTDWLEEHMLNVLYRRKTS